MFITRAKNAIPIHIILTTDSKKYFSQLDSKRQNIFKTAKFEAKSHQHCLIYDEAGKLSDVYMGVDKPDIFSIAELALKLPEAIYQIDDPEEVLKNIDVEIGWGLGSYQYTQYKNPKRAPATLVVQQAKKLEQINSIVTTVNMVRDWINTPAEAMGPSELANQIKLIADKFNAKCKVIVGDQLLKQNFPLIHAVGRACDDAPRLVELTWGKKSDRALTLVGKGVCFDTGGLDLKSASNMLTMKKDMGGAANAVGLASLIMAANLPIYLRVLIPIVENSVAGNSMRPGDVFTARSGRTVEIGNTDAEGRLILADALTYAVEAKPDLIIDFATLTGAARVALGTEIAVVFSDNQQQAAKIQEYAYAANCRDPIWPLPLHKSYRHWLDSDIADINNASHHSWGGAITAALFLREFVPAEINWMHFDMMAANIENLAGRPKGGEAQAIRALFAWLQENF